MRGNSMRLSGATLHRFQWRLGCATHRVGADRQCAICVALDDATVVYCGDVGHASTSIFDDIGTCVAADESRFGAPA